MVNSIFMILLLSLTFRLGVYYLLSLFLLVQRTCSVWYDILGYLHSSIV